MQSFKPLNGFRDDAAAAPCSRLERRLWDWSASLGFGPVELPLVERRSLFERAVGLETDVVGKEMFPFGDGSRALRPEGTAGAMRAWANAGGRSLGPVRWAYCGPMFRNERPQAGRYRQFRQFGLEAIGVPEGAIEADLLAAMDDLFAALGIRERVACRDALRAFLLARLDRLDPVSQGRATSNPLRVWDSKDPGTQAALADAPRLASFLGPESLAAWTALRRSLDALGVRYEADPTLMRGLDYYNGPVFEWVGDSGAAQSAVAAGGRYDGLAAAIGADAAPAFGLALGVERVLALMPEAKAEPQGCYLAWMGGEAERGWALLCARSLRRQGWRVTLGDGGRKLGREIARANELGCRTLALVGERERLAGAVALKDLETGEQRQQAIAP